MVEVTRYTFITNKKLDLLKMYYHMLNLLFYNEKGKGWRIKARSWYALPETEICVCTDREETQKMPKCWLFRVMKLWEILSLFFWNIMR